MSNAHRTDYPTLYGYARRELTGSYRGASASIPEGTEVRVIERPGGRFIVKALGFKSSAMSFDALLDRVVPA